jgi:clan AA aspartic protease (TIGR02281 family)
MRKTLPILFVLFLISCGVLFADTIYLKNGRKINGIVKNEEDGMVELEVGGGVVKFKSSEIEKMEISEIGERQQMREDWETQKQRMQEKIVQQQIEEAQQPKRVEFSRDSRGITLTVKLNKKADVRLVMDTGSALIVLRRSVAKKLGINLDNVTPDAKLIVADGRKVDAKLVTLTSVEVEGVEANGVQAAVMLEEVQGGLLYEEGLLGMSFLKRFNFKVDQRQKRLILEKI